MHKDTAVVLTAKSIERIIKEGGTSSWHLDRNHARHCDYAVCTRNAHAKWVEGPEAHHSAFLIGKVRDVVPCVSTPENNESPENRYLIKFSEFARVNIPNIWKGTRNPIRYMSLEELGIDPSVLEWEIMPESITQSAGENPTKALPVSSLTIAEAKKGLALTFRVQPEAIEIIVRG